MKHETKLHTLSDGSFAARFYDLAERRRALRLGRERGPAGDFVHDLGRLLEYRRAGRSLPADVETWVSRLPPSRLKKLVSWGILEASGLAATEPITIHLAAFWAALASKVIRGRKLSPKRVDDVIKRIRATVDDCGLKLWSDVTEEVLHAYLSDLRERGRPLPADAINRGRKPRALAQMTARGYAQAWIQFARWMLRTRRALVNPLARLQPADYGTVSETERRAFSAEELRVLLDAVESGSGRFGLSGAERSLLYLVAAETGLRASELAAVRVNQFDLTAAQPVVRLTAEQTKSKKGAELPIRKATAALLADHFSRKTAKAPAFAMPSLYSLADMLRGDLASARSVWLLAAPTPGERQAREASDFLAERDRQGRVAVFHSLRHSTGSMMVAAGVHPKLAQGRMRHSTIGLTMDLYSKAGDAQAGEVAEQMPELRRRVAAVATGTDGERSKSAPIFVQNCPSNRPDVSATGVRLDAERSEETGEFSGENVQLSATVAKIPNGADRARTGDLCVANAQGANQPVTQALNGKAVTLQAAPDGGRSAPISEHLRDLVASLQRLDDAQLARVESFVEGLFSTDPKGPAQCGPAEKTAP